MYFLTSRQDAVKVHVNLISKIYWNLSILSCESCTFELIKYETCLKKKYIVYPYTLIFLSRSLGEVTGINQAADWLWCKPRKYQLKQGNLDILSVTHSLILSETRDSHAHELHLNQLQHMTCGYFEELQAISEIKPSFKNQEHCYKNSSLESKKSQQDTGFQWLDTLF